jgi:cardiolipin synthase
MQRFGWVLILIFLPGLGLLLYWFIGSDFLKAYRKKKIRERRGDFFNELEEIVAETGSQFESPSSEGLVFHQRYCGSIFTDDNDIEIFITGGPKYKRLFEDIEAAQDSIHVMYFTIHNDGIGRKLIDALIEKVRQGVEVKLIYDGLGCFSSFIYPQVRRLRKAGGGVTAIRPYTRTINYRNHRKIVVIDGKIGYLGGMNIGDQYKDGVKDKHWRDTHVRVTGSMVHDLQKVFLSDWAASVKGSDIGLRHDLRHYFPAPDIRGNIKGQIVANGLYSNDNDEIINLSYFNLISRAKKRVWIQTPYFRPPDTIFHALKTLATLGVDVRLMVSLSYASGGFLNRCLNSYFLRQLIGSGVRVYGYTNIMHGKTMIVDDHGLCIGTVNINTRSLQIDDEIYGYFESQSLVAKYEKIFEEDLAHCIEADSVGFADQNLLIRAAESVISFLTPIS